MVSAFSSRLNHTLLNLSLPGPVLQQVQTDEIKLAGAQVPDNLDAGTRAAVKELIGEAFIFGFRIVMFICAGLFRRSPEVFRRFERCVLKSLRWLRAVIRTHAEPAQDCQSVQAGRDSEIGSRISRQAIEPRKGVGACERTEAPSHVHGSRHTA